jgi:hypothetical protein
MQLCLKVIKVSKLLCINAVLSLINVLLAPAKSGKEHIWLSEPLTQCKMPVIAINSFFEVANI